MPGAFQRYEYTYRIVVTIAEVNYVFEPDEEGHYRAPECAQPDVGLLRAVAERLEKL